MTPQPTTREFTKLGYSMWKTPGSNGEWHYITAHLCPNRFYLQISDKKTDNIHLICSCKDFTIGIASREGNALVTPCKHIRDFDESEVDIETLERRHKG